MINIVLMHGPVIETEYAGNDTVIYTLENGKQYKIAFTMNGRLFVRIVTDETGKTYRDESDFDIFNDGLTVYDFMQWTADNFHEITELMEG